MSSYHRKFKHNFDLLDNKRKNPNNVSVSAYAVS